MRTHVLERDGHRCQRCGFTAKPDSIEVKALTLDHILPRSLGGRTRSWNLQTFCLNCQIIKGNAAPTPAEVARSRRLQRG